MIRRFAAMALFLSVPFDAGAEIEWATWSGYPAATRTGTFVTGGVTVTMQDTTFAGVGSVPADTSDAFISETPVVGKTTTGNPPYQQILSGPVGGALTNVGDEVVEIDLSGLPAGAQPVFGIADQKFDYKIEFKDMAGDTGTALPIEDDVTHELTVTVLPYDIKYPTPSPPAFPDGVIADQNSLLSLAGVLTRDNNNDGFDDGSGMTKTDFYNQTGLTVFTNLPAGTRAIRLSVAAIGQAEGLSLFVGADFPKKTGDVNGDGITNIVDALKALRISVGLDSSSDDIVATSDMNGDGVITITDALAILKKAVGL